MAAGRVGRDGWHMEYHTDVWEGCQGVIATSSRFPIAPAFRQAIAGVVSEWIQGKVFYSAWAMLFVRGDRSYYSAWRRNLTLKG